MVAGCAVCVAEVQLNCLLGCKVGHCITEVSQVDQAWFAVAKLHNCKWELYNHSSFRDNSKKPFLPFHTVSCTQCGSKCVFLPGFWSSSSTCISSALCYSTEVVCYLQKRLEMVAMKASRNKFLFLPSVF